MYHKLGWGSAARTNLGVLGLGQDDAVLGDLHAAALRVVLADDLKLLLLCIGSYMFF